MNDIQKLLQFWIQGRRVVWRFIGRGGSIYFVYEGQNVALRDIRRECAPVHLFALKFALPDSPDQQAERPATGGNTVPFRQCGMLPIFPAPIEWVIADAQ